MKTTSPVINMFWDGKPPDLGLAGGALARACFDEDAFRDLMAAAAQIPIPQQSGMLSEADILALVRLRVGATESVTYLRMALTNAGNIGNVRQIVTTRAGEADISWLQHRR